MTQEFDVWRNLFFFSLIITVDVIQYRPMRILFCGLLDLIDVFKNLFNKFSVFNNVIKCTYYAIFIENPLARIQAISRSSAINSDILVTYRRARSVVDVDKLTSITLNPL